MFYKVDDHLTVNPIPTIEEATPAVEETTPVVEAEKVEAFDGYRFWEIKVQDAGRYNKYFASVDLEKDEALFKAALEAEQNARRRDAQALLDAALAESDRRRR